MDALEMSEKNLLALRGLVESYHTLLFASVHADSLLVFHAGQRLVSNAEASCLRAILAIDPPTAHEIRRIGGLLAKDTFEPWDAVLARLGIDLMREDSEFDVLDTPDAEGES